MENLLKKMKKQIKLDIQNRLSLAGIMEKEKSTDNCVEELVPFSINLAEEMMDVDSLEEAIQKAIDATKKVQSIVAKHYPGLGVEMPDFQKIVDEA